MKKLHKQSQLRVGSWNCDLSYSFFSKRAGIGEDVQNANLSLPCHSFISIQTFSFFFLVQVGTIICSRKKIFTIFFVFISVLKNPKSSLHFQDLKSWLIIAVTHTTWAVVKLKPEKNSGLNWIRTHDLCDTGAVLYQRSYQAIWELVTLCV